MRSPWEWIDDPEDLPAGRAVFGRELDIDTGRPGRSVTRGADTEEQLRAVLDTPEGIEELLLLRGRMRGDTDGGD
jgi:hypothetical protein